MTDRLNKKRGQEEMIGFGLIIVIVAVILLVFLWYSSTQQGEENLDSSEVENFLNSYTAYTSSCSDKISSFRTVEDLVKDCDPQDQSKECGDKGICQALNDTTKKILNESWQVGPNRPEKGYEFKIKETKKDSDGVVGLITDIEKGNVSKSTYKGSSRTIPGSGDSNYDIVLRIYS